MKKTMRYLIGAFGLAWILQVLDGLLFRQGNSLAYSALLSGSMFAPLLAAAVSRPGCGSWAGGPVSEKMLAGCWPPGFCRPFWEPSGLPFTFGLCPGHGILRLLMFRPC